MSRRLRRPRRTRPALAVPPDPGNHRVRLRARGAPDLIALIPFQLGFHPTESVVAVFVDRGTMKLTARVDLPPPEGAAEFAAGLRALARQHRADELVLFAYSAEPGPARALLAGLLAALPRRLVYEALYVDAERWWSMTCQQACCPLEGTPYDIEGHRLAAEAVFAGLTARASRSDLAATVTGPPESDGPALADLAAEVQAAQARATDLDPATTVLRLLDPAVADPAGLDDRRCVELAVLVSDVGRRDLAWSLIDRANAEEHLAVWQRVVARVPPGLSAAPLGLLGLAAWLSGNGALLNCAVDVLERCHPSYSLGHLLATISARALPPSMGDEIARDLRRGVDRLAG